MKLLFYLSMIFLLFSCQGKIKDDIDAIVAKTCACKSKTGQELNDCKTEIEKEAEELDKRIQELPEDEKKEMEEYVRLKMNDCH
jgi:F0F1-type ATP synthase membrane subunit b/b'